MSTINGEEEADSQYAMQLANISILPMVLKAAIELGVLDIIHRDGAGVLLSPSQITICGFAPVSKYFIKNQGGVSLAPLLNLCHDKVILDNWYHLKYAVLE
ncbi:hypothetical protein ACFX15_014473 [Malus domestica]